MQWAQTANYGVAPNPAMPNVFMAQAFDLSDPFGNITCYKSGCCRGAQKAGTNCGSCLGPNGYCESMTATNFYMGPIHPRVKKIVGERLAKAGAVIAYGKTGIHTGPTISGCSMSSGKITIKFNSTLLGSDQVLVQDYDKMANNSMMQVLTNSKLFCMQTKRLGKDKDAGQECIDDGTNHDIGKGMFDDEEKTWVSVDIAAASSNSITVDLKKSGGVAFAIRYAWDRNGCCEGLPSVLAGGPCPIASCPLMAKTAQLPANPFKAKIIGGKCHCIAPQVCDEQSITEPELII
jgi:hypothetical protein